jgi:hypothetical protein
MGGAKAAGTIGAGAMAAGAAYQAYSQYQSGQWNQQASEIMARDAIARGQFAEGAAKARGTRTVAAGTAAYASGGVDVSRGSPVAVAAGTRSISALDAAMARFNGMREAYGFRVRGQLASTEASNQALGTLLTGASQASMAAYRAGVGNPDNTKPDLYNAAVDPVAANTPTMNAYDMLNMPIFDRAA